jgi:polysaccharide deacetylase 2 family uncharacterized protein YibQ
MTRDSSYGSLGGHILAIAAPALAGVATGLLAVALAWLALAPQPGPPESPPVLVQALPLPERPRPAPVAAIAPPPDVAETPALRPAWQRFAAAHHAPAEWPRVVVVIDDVGPDRTGASRILALPPPLTISILPYAERAGEDAAEARRRGHEVMLHLPMEAVSANENPGPQALRVQLAQDELRRRLDWNLDRFDGYAAVNNHMGSRATADESVMTAVMAALAVRGLAWLDSRTTPRSLGLSAAAAHGVIAAGRDLFLDNDLSRPAIDAQLAALTRLARQRGIAIAIGHPHAATIEALSAWLPGLAAQQIALVPFSAALAPLPDNRAALLSGR